MKSISSIPAIFIFLFLTAGCRGNQQASAPPGPQPSVSAADTGKVEQALRAYEALPPGTAGKEATLRNILRETIAIGYHDQACHLLLDIARHHAEQGNFDSTRHYYQLARGHCNQPIFDKTLPAALLTESGAYYHSLQSDYVAANNSFYAALHYLKENGLTENELTISLYLYLIGMQERLGNHDQALAYLQEAEQLSIRLNSRRALVAVRASFGDYYFERKDYLLAGKYYDLALEDIRTFWSPEWDPNIRIVALLGKASVLTVTGEASAALPFLEKAIAIAQEHHREYAEAGAVIELGSAYNRLGRFAETIRLVTPLRQTKESGFNWRKEDGYRVLMDAHEGLGRYRQALAYQRELYKLSDSLISREKTGALQELELKYQTALKDRDIAGKRLLIEQQRSRLSRQNFLIGSISAAAVLAVLLLWLLYKNAAHKQHLQQLEIDTLRRQQEINILRSSIEGEEQERRRLARELHDGIGSMIFSGIMRVSLLKKKDPALVTTRDYEEVLHLLEQTGSEIRKTAHNMMPDIIHQQTLAEAVQAYCETLTRGTSVHMDVQFYGEGDPFPEAVRLVIYRMIQELVHNVVKHAHATYAIVQGVLNEDHFTITVEDNGTGFDPATARKGLGLRNLEARIRSLAGTFQIESAPGKGTTVYLEFDCRQLQT